MSVRRLPAASGVRPPARPARVRRRCVICRRRFTLNRRRHPWARAVTCSPSCRVSYAHRRRFAGCRHCDVVESWRLTVEAAKVALDVACRDEDARPPTFREFLTGYRFEPWDAPAGEEEVEAA